MQVDTPSFIAKPPPSSAPLSHQSGAASRIVSSQFLRMYVVRFKVSSLVPAHRGPNSITWPFFSLMTWNPVFSIELNRLVKLIQQILSFVKIGRASGRGRG